MSNRTSIYKFLYSQFGDIWYPGYDYENMVSIERQLSGVNSIVGPGVINGWTIEKLSDSRTNQLLLLNGYVSSSTSEYGLKLSALNLGFTVTVKAATVSNISLSGQQTIDNVAVVTGDIVLVKNQSTSANNGIYTVASGSWTRNSSLDNTLDYNSNFVVYVQEGYVWKRYGYSPSVRDIAYQRGRSGLGNTLEIVDRLVAKGVLKKLRKSGRSIRPVYINFKNLE